jgi:DNA-binding transcriptional LysR family regulator
MAFEMLSWDDFRYVKAIAQGRSLASAAEELGVNHSTVFRRLGQIEGRLGSRLFERSRSGYTLTPCGEEMVRLAEQMENDIVAFERQVTGRDLRPSGELRVTTNDALLVHMLSDLFAGFRRSYPEIVLDVVISNSSLNLSKRDADVAVRATNRAPDTLVGRRIAAFGCAVYGRADTARRRITFAEAGQYDWVGLGENLAGIKIAKWLRDHVPGERIVYRVNTVLGLAEAIQAGLGLGFLPCVIGAATPGLVQLSEVVPEVGGDLWLLTHPDLRQTARVRAFMDYAGAELTKKRRLIEGEVEARLVEPA